MIDQPVIEPVIDNSLSVFISQLNKYIPSDQIKLNYRITTNGLFLKESSLIELVQAYQKHNKEISGAEQEKDFQKSIKKLFNTDEPEIVYLIEGKNAYTGFLIPKIGRTNFIPFFQGRPLEATTYLHPRDPILAQLPGLTSKTGTNGFEFSFVHKKFTYDFTLEDVKNFREIAVSSSIKKIYPQACKSVRYALVAMVEIFKQVKLFKAKRKLFMPQAFAGKKQYKILVWKRIILITENTKLRLVYTTKGRGLVNLIMSELENTSSLRSLTKFQAFNRSRNVGMFHMPARSFELSRGALCDFIENCAVEAPNSLPEYFTIKDCIAALIKLLETADEMPEAKLPELLRSRANRSVLFYEKQDWIFMVLRKITILSIYHRHQKKLKNRRPDRFRS